MKTKTKNLLLGIAIGMGFSVATVAQNVPNYVPTNGLVGWWPFNGNANDESGNNNNGTVNGATLTADRFGNANKAYSFDGIDDFIKCINAGPTGNPTISLSFWVKKPNNTYGHVIGYGNNGINGKDLRIYFGSGHCSSGSIAFDTYNSAKTVTDNQNNQWDFYTIIYNGNRGVNTNASIIYKNNILLNSVCYSINCNSHYFI